MAARALQLTLDGAALLAGDEDAAGMWGMVATVSLVDIDPLDLTPGELFGVLDNRPSHGLSGSAFVCSTNWPREARALMVTTETLMPN
jgi:hypothetical protein